MHNKAQKFKCETVVDKYSKGAAYIPFKADIYFQENRRDWTVSLRYLDNNDKNPIIIKFKRYIPPYIYPCQILSKHVTQVSLNTQFIVDKKSKSYGIYHQY